MAAIQTDAASSRYVGTVGGRASASDGLLSRVKSDRGLLRRVLMIGGVAIVGLVSLSTWLFGGRYVGTDDAYVHAAQLMVSTDVSGLVRDVEGPQGQLVKAGPVLFRICPQQFQIPLGNAQAN